MIKKYFVVAVAFEEVPDDSTLDFLREELAGVASLEGEAAINGAAVYEVTEGDTIQELVVE